MTTPTEAPAAAAGVLTLEDVAHLPRPGTNVPTRIAWMPDGKGLSFLYSEDASLVRQLYRVDIDTGERSVLVLPPGGGATEENLSLEEKLRRERARERGLGITSYGWARDGGLLLVPNRGDLYVAKDVSAADGDEAVALTQILEAATVPGAGGPALDPQLSDDGSQVAYVQDEELYVLDTAGGTPLQLTRGARGTGLVHGLAEYIAQEEMSRRHGFWWSPDGSSIAYTQIDESHIPSFRIMHQGKDAVGEGAQEDHAYPFAGQPNAKVRLGVVSADGGPTRWMDLEVGEDPHAYLARVHWAADGSLLAEVQDRAQATLTLYRFDPQTGARTEILRESSEVWINLNHLYRALPAAGSGGRPGFTGDYADGFVWGSERSGFQHLYLYDRDGRLLRPLTQGDWMVESIAGFDPVQEVVYVLGTLDSPLERHLYAVSLKADGGEPRRITTEPGMHGVVLQRLSAEQAPEHFVDVLSEPGGPPRVSIRRLADGAETLAIELPSDPRVEALGPGLKPPEFVSFEHDGVTLHGAIYAPDGPGPHPTLVSVYGGPHAQRVHRGWDMSVDLRAQYLRQRGFLLFKLDNRGSARRGLAFEGAIRHDLGNIEIQDQVAGVQWLVEQGRTDPDRVGMYGWSYGGYMSAMAVTRAPETFHVAVAGAPVTHWDGYDTHYTERYMGTPQSNPEGYVRSSVMAHVDGLKGDLMLVHGLIDENVHFRHTARLANALIAARKDYELLLFPDERHSPRSEGDRVYMEQRVVAYLERVLKE